MENTARSCRSPLPWHSMGWRRSPPRIGLPILPILFCAIAGMAAAEEALDKEHVQSAVRFYGAAGIGLPDLIHAELGYFVSPRVSLEAHADWILFNPMLGVGATYAFGRTASSRPPRHAFLTHAQALLNPTLGRIELRSEGEILAALVGLYGGYGFLADNGFYFRALAGGLLYDDQGFAAGPNVTLSAGWAF